MVRIVVLLLVPAAVGAVLWVAAPTASAFDLATASLPSTIVVSARTGAGSALIRRVAPGAVSVVAAAELLTGAGTLVRPEDPGERSTDGLWRRR